MTLTSVWNKRSMIIQQRLLTIKKKKNNMVTRRAAKSKGNQFEYSVKDSLVPLMEDIVLTKELGFQSQFDLQSDKHKTCIECKRHRSFTWNELVKLFEKLKEKSIEGYKNYLIFQPNRQPCLVMLEDNGVLIVKTFESEFNTEFIKHIGRKKNDS